MLTFFTDLNYWAIIVASISNMILGMIWYNPSVFGSAWMRMSGIKMPSKEEMKNMNMSGYYFAAFIGALVTGTILAHFISWTGAASIVDGLVLSSIIWVGFIATSLLAGVLWEGKPIALYFLNSLYYLVAYAIMSVILVLWN